MAISLFDISIAPYKQTLGAVVGFLEKARSHCEAQGIGLGEIVETRLYKDMLPFSFQVHSVVYHSIGAINGVSIGVFEPPKDLPDLDYAGLEKTVANALETLEEFTPQKVNALQGQDVVFQIGDREVPFTAEHFILSFSLPNLYFHAATAYDILRMKGVPLAKRQFLGQLRVKD